MPRTLLIVDDSVTVQRVIELTFADEKVRVVAASDGDRAIAALEQSPPDIVLADIGMASPNGYEVTAYIRSRPGLAHIPVLLLTGALEPVDWARAAGVGCDGILTKPFEPQVVVARVTELLERGRPAGSPDDAAHRPPAETPDGSAGRGGEGLFLAPLAGRSPSGVPDPREIDEYFSRLDAALAAASPSARDTGGPGSTRARGPVARPDPRAARPDLPGPEADGARTASGARAASDATEDTQSNRTSVPVLAEAFAALLAAERRSVEGGKAPTWPMSLPTSGVATDDLVEAVTARVLARLSDASMRAIVPDLVSDLAERLIKEEIERIKSSIK